MKRASVAIALLLGLSVSSRVASAKAKFQSLTDLSGPLSGTKSVHVRLDHGMDFETFGWVVLDGKIHDHKQGDKIYVWNPSHPGSLTHEYSIDTTDLADGPHNLALTVYTVPAKGVVKQLTTCLETTITTRNGASYRGPMPKWAELRLHPGESTPIDARDLRCDGTTADRPATDFQYAVADPPVATVSDSGVVTATKIGATTIVVRRAGRSRQIRVVVDPAGMGFPQFARDGEILHAHDRRRSVFVRSVFGLNPTETKATPGLLARVKRAGINAFDQGFYQAPVAGVDQATYLHNAAASYDATLNYAAASGLMLVAGGDNWARGASVLDATLNNPQAKAGTALALAKLRRSKIVPMIELVDEATATLGTSPPAGVDALMALLDRTPKRTPVAWSTFSNHGADVIRNWENHNNYHSWMFHPPGWAETGTGLSVATWTSSLEERVIEGRRVSDGTKPLAVSNISICGDYYWTSAGVDPRIGPGILLEPGVASDRITAQIWSAVALGAAALRAYHFDTTAWQQNRANARAGENLQTGAAPAGYGAGADRWAALSASYNLIARIEPALLQPMTTAIDVGPGFLTGAHGGPTSRVLIVVSTQDVASTALVDLKPYRAGGFDHGIRYSVDGSRSAADSLSSAEQDRPTVHPGAAVIYLFVSGPYAAKMFTVPPRARPSPTSTRPGR